MTKFKAPEYLVCALCIAMVCIAAFTVPSVRISATENAEKQERSFLPRIQYWFYSEKEQDWVHSDYIPFYAIMLQHPSILQNSFMGLFSTMEACLTLVRREVDKQQHRMDSAPNGPAYEGLQGSCEEIKGIPPKPTHVPSKTDESSA